MRWAIRSRRERDAMGALLVFAAIIIAIVAFVAYAAILIDAFQDEAWKGLLGFVVPIYLVYYAIFEYDHEHKWPIVATMFFGGGIGGLLLKAGLALMGRH